MTTKDIMDILSNSFAPGGVTVAGLLLAILIAGSRGLWYYGGVHRECMKDRDEWKNIAMTATATVKEQTSQIERLTDLVESLSKTGRKR